MRSGAGKARQCASCQCRQKGIKRKVQREDPSQGGSYIAAPTKDSGSAPANGRGRPASLSARQSLHNDAGSTGEFYALIQADLAAKERLPAEQLFDAGYVDAGLLVDSQNQYQVEVIGSVSSDPCWQALTEGAYAVSHFVIDWQAKRVTCPQGQASQKWSQTHNHVGTSIIKVRFAPKACAQCPVRAQCTRSASGPRHMTLHPRPEHEALQQRRIFRGSAEFKQRYDARAGIEGALSQAVRVIGLRRSRYIGLTKTRLQHVLCATTINLYRITNYLAELPIAHTRTSTFAAPALSP